MRRVRYRPVQRAFRAAILSGHDIAVRIQRGGGTWPCEAPATTRTGESRDENGANSIGLQKKSGRCDWGAPTEASVTAKAAEVFKFIGRFPMPVEALQCKECHEQY